MMPKRISEDLPGLLVNDDMTAGLRSKIDHLVDYPELYPRPTGSGWPTTSRCCVRTRRRSRRYG